MPLDLDRLEALANAATQGPWHLNEEGFGKHGVPTIYATDEELRYIAKCRDLPAHENHAPTDDRANARFIATARTAIPQLITEIRRLRAELAQQQPAITNPGTARR